MEYLITGSKGFIGRNLTSYMIKKKIPFQVSDIGPNSSPCTIIHLSAATNVRKSVKDPINSFEKNTRKTFEWFLTRQ